MLACVQIWNVYLHICSIKIFGTWPYFNVGYTHVLQSSPTTWSWGMQTSSPCYDIFHDLPNHRKDLNIMLEVTLTTLFNGFGYFLINCHTTILHFVVSLHNDKRLFRFAQFVLSHNSFTVLYRASDHTWASDSSVVFRGFPCNRPPC